MTFQIANTKNQPDAQLKLFELSLPILQDFLAKSRMVLTASPAQEAKLSRLHHYFPLAETGYCNAYRFQIQGLKVANEAVPRRDKLCSIFEPHTDMIVKGAREVSFGHKVNLVGGRSHLILGVEIPEGKPKATVKLLKQKTLPGYHSRHFCLVESALLQACRIDPRGGVFS